MRLINLKGETNFRYLCAQANRLGRVAGVAGSLMTRTVPTKGISWQIQPKGSVYLKVMKCETGTTCVNKVR